MSVDVLAVAGNVPKAHVEGLGRLEERFRVYLSYVDLPSYFFCGRVVLFTGFGIYEGSQKGTTLQSSGRVQGHAVFLVLSFASSLKMYSRVCGDSRS